MPVVVDIRDLWPDVFADAFPPKIRKIGHWLLAPYRTMARRACRDASAIVGPTEEFVAVSYTHLDVYKRQIITNLSRMKRWTLSFCADGPTTKGGGAR